MAKPKKKFLPPWMKGKDEEEVKGKEAPKKKSKPKSKKKC